MPASNLPTLKISAVIQHEYLSSNVAQHHSTAMQLLCSRWRISHHYSTPLRQQANTFMRFAPDFTQDLLNQEVAKDVVTTTYFL